MALLLDTSSEHSQDDKFKFNGYINAVRKLLTDQLSEQEVVYLMEFGSKVNPVEPAALPFAASRER